MDEDNNIIGTFISKRLRIRQSDGTYITGDSISIDAYLNVMLTDVEYVNDGDRSNYKFMFVRGSFVESMSIE